MQRVTQHLNLHTGTSVWYARRRAMPTGRTLRGDIRTDVLIVGAGISGILCAYELSKYDLSVALVDRRGPLRGSTAASTALLQFELDLPLVKLQRQLGVNAAREVWMNRVAASFG